MSLKEYLYRKERLYHLRRKATDTIRQINLSKTSISIFDHINDSKRYNFMLDYRNIPERIEQIFHTHFAIVYSISNTIAYHNLYSELVDENKVETTLSYERELFLKNAIYELFTFRERILHLFTELFLNNLNPKRKNFYGYLNELRNTVNNINQLKEFTDNIKWITKSEVLEILSFLNAINSAKVREVKNIRNTLTHECSVGIDYIGFMEFKIEEIEAPKEFPDSSKEWISISPISSQNFKYEDLLKMVIEVWELFCSETESIMKKVNILKEFLVFDS